MVINIFCVNEFCCKNDLYNMYFYINGFTLYGCQNIYWLY